MSIVTRVRRWLSSESTSSADSKPTEPNPVAVIDLAAGYQAYENGDRFIDVREPDEWAAGHIAGAVHRPVGAIEADPRLSVDRDKPIVTYCAAGARAKRAATALAAHGYADVKSLAAGYGDWQTAGYPVEHSQDDTAT